MQLKKYAVAAILSLAAAGASAQQKESGFIGFEAGWASIDQETRALNNAQTIANLSGRTTTVTYDKGTAAGRVFLGLDVSKDFGIEFGYFFTGDLDTKYTNSAGSATEKYRATGFDAALLIKPESFNGLFLKAGMHRSEVEGEASVTIGGTRYAITATESGTGWLVGAGYDWQIGSDKTLHGRIAYTFYNKLGGMSDADANVFTLGILKRF